MRYQVAGAMREPDHVGLVQDTRPTGRVPASALFPLHETSLLELDLNGERLEVGPELSPLVGVELRVDWILGVEFAARVADSLSQVLKVVVGLVLSEARDDD